VRRTDGLTLIEILVSLTLLAIMVTFIVQSLAGSFQLTRDNRRALDASAATQRILEDVRGQWQSRTLFNERCATLTLNPAGSTFMTLTAQVAPHPSPLQNTTTNPPTLIYTNLTTTGCSTPPPPPTPPATLPPCVALMQRIAVTATRTSPTAELSRVTLDIPCPENP
jgi:prepilin-type N-terminal cleavage/methylation domain-containing protein